VTEGDKRAMSRDEALRLLLSGPAGVEEFNRRRAVVPDIEDGLRWAVLTEADLRGANLDDLDLSESSLVGADLREAQLRRSNLDGADLTRADLSGTALERAALRRVTLNDAMLIDAVLVRADLTDAVMLRTVLRGAQLGGAILNGADLSEADLRSTDVPDDEPPAVNDRTRFAGTRIDNAMAWHRSLNDTQIRQCLIREPGRSQGISAELAAMAGPHEITQLPSFSLYIDPGEAPVEVVRDVLAALRALYGRCGGDGMIFEIDPDGVLIAQGIPA
jgi:uncharacterized protein YjbI with pentapeptide repeats